MSRNEMTLRATGLHDVAYGLLRDSLRSVYGSGAHA